MKFLVCTDTTMPGGVDGYVVALASRLAEKGHEAIVLLDDCAGADDLARAASKAGHEVLRRPISHLHDEAVSYGAVAALLMERAFDRCHFILTTPCSCLTLRKAAADLGAAFSWTEQLVPPDYVISDERKIMISHFHQCARAVVCVSGENRNLLRDKFGFPDDKMHVVQNGVDPERFFPIPLSERAVRRAELIDEKADFVAGCVARLHRQKGIDVLLRALAAAKEKLGDAQSVTACLIGDGPEKENLVALARELGIEDRVRFLGWRDDVESLLPAMDIFVLPSRFEGLPFSVLEAMAAGVAVVATSVSGTPELVEDGRSGLLVPPDDPTTLADAIVRLADDCSLIERLAAAGRARILAEFTLAGCLDKTLELIV